MASDIRTYVVSRGKTRVSTKRRRPRICFNRTQIPVVIILPWCRGKPTPANLACNSPMPEPGEGKSEYEPILHTRPPGQGEPDHATGDDRRRSYFHAHGGTRHCCSDTYANANADVSLGDYRVHQPVDSARQLSLVQPWICGRILALRQQLLARVRHGNLHRFPTVQRDRGFLRD